MHREYGRSRAKWRGIGLAAALMLLSACSILPGRSDPIPTPIAANPASLRIALLAPEPFHMLKDEVKLTVYQRGGGNDISRDYMLVAADNEAAEAAVARLRKPGQVLQVYRLTPADALALHDQQQEMAAARTGSAKPGFSVDLDTSCWNAAMIDPAVPLDVLIEAGDGTGFHPLLSDINIFSLMNRPEGSRLKSCSEK
ncbi:hypothetical protein [Martelella endophytica]|uniref:Lipoprotein n=1 Tax=Martelella endophytica TaxID=1486262 RepID=A0A0D5LME8_MAREN|nr:hypothetical protein [Martelella endophytica]AJY45341.1 hypothetical protein TM49_05960 [Martelella endophytica]